MSEQAAGIVKTSADLQNYNTNEFLPKDMTRHSKAWFPFKAIACVA